MADFLNRKQIINDPAPLQVHKGESDEAHKSQPLPEIRECKTLRAPYFSIKTLFSMSFHYKNLQSSWFA